MDVSYNSRWVIAACEFVTSGARDPDLCRDVRNCVALSPLHAPLQGGDHTQGSILWRWRLIAWNDEFVVTAWFLHQHERKFAGSSTRLYFIYQLFTWCRLRDSNPRPPDYKSGALPTELSRRAANPIKEPAVAVKAPVRAVPARCRSLFRLEPRVRLEKARDHHPCQAKNGGVDAKHRETDGVIAGTEDDRSDRLPGEEP